MKATGMSDDGFAQAIHRFFVDTLEMLSDGRP
jgi:hypothetical protein